jgi:hypothetical protein
MRGSSRLQFEGYDDTVSSILNLNVIKSISVEARLCCRKFGKRNFDVKAITTPESLVIVQG